MKQRGVCLGRGKRSVCFDYEKTLLREQTGRIIIVSISIIVISIIIVIIIIINTCRPSCCHAAQWPGVVGNRSGVEAEQLV